MALYGMECIDLMDDVIQILNIYFSSNKKLEQEKSFLNHIVKIQNILKLWKPRNLTIEGGIVVFKLLAISKLIYPALVTEIPTSTIRLLTKIQTESIREGKIRKLKRVLYVYFIFKSCKLTMLLDKKRLFDNNFHQWKVILLYLIRQYSGKIFKFHFHLEVNHSILCNFPKFYKNVFIIWGEHLSSLANLQSTVPCQFIWYNNHIQTIIFK